MPSPSRLCQRLLLVLGLTGLGPVAACCFSPERVKAQELCYDQPAGVTSACASLPEVSSSAWPGPTLRPKDGQSRAASRLCEAHFTSGPVRRETVGGEHDCCYRADTAYCPKGGRPLLVSSMARLADLVADASWSS